MRDGKILTARESWLLQTQNRVARGERPLLPGQRHEGDPVAVNYEFSKADYDRWAEHVRQAVNSCLHVPTLEEWLQGRQSADQTAHGRSRAAWEKLNEHRRAAYPRQPQ